MIIIEGVLLLKFLKKTRQIVEEQHALEIDNHHHKNHWHIYIEMIEYGIDIIV